MPTDPTQTHETADTPANTSDQDAIPTDVTTDSSTSTETESTPLRPSQARRDTRRLAMQLIYQMGYGTEAEKPNLMSIVSGITPEEEDGLVRDDDRVQEQAVDLALKAWAVHEESDQAVTELAPDWPSHRQPAVDRAILRLAYYEVTTQRVAVNIAINEAIELSKQFASENSPAFVNGVLDKLAKSVSKTNATDTASSNTNTTNNTSEASDSDNQSPPAANPAAIQTGDDWLDDATANAQNA